METRFFGKQARLWRNSKTSAAECVFGESHPHVQLLYHRLCKLRRGAARLLPDLFWLA